MLNERVDSSGERYAVIAGLCTETGPERLVIAYPNEQSLRELIASASIIAFGFSSREEAVAASRASLSAAVCRQQVFEARARREIEKQRQRFSWAAPREQTASVLHRLARFLVRSYGEAATTAIVFFSSRNLVSAVIRLALGSSV